MRKKAAARPLAPPPDPAAALFRAWSALAPVSCVPRPVLQAGVTQVPRCAERWTWPGRTGGSHASPSSPLYCRIVQLACSQEPGRARRSPYHRTDSCMQSRPACRMAALSVHSCWLGGEAGPNQQAGDR